MMPTADAYYDVQDEDVCPECESNPCECGAEPDWESEAELRELRDERW